MGMTVSRVGQLLACCLVAWALVACSAGDGPDERPAPVAETPLSSGSASAQRSEMSEAMTELAAAASSAAAGLPTLLLIENRTSGTVLLTSADGKKTATVDAGRTMSLGSERVCRWLPLTASSSDGEVIAVYAKPCRGQTWTITD